MNSYIDKVKINVNNAKEALNNALKMLTDSISVDDKAFEENKIESSVIKLTSQIEILNIYIIPEAQKQTK